MQVRRSARLRNRISGTPESNRSSTFGSTPNNLRGDRNNVDNNIGHDALMMPNFGDLVPNEQGQGDAIPLFNEQILTRDENMFQSFLTNLCLICVTVAVVFTFILLLFYIFTTNNNYNFEASNDSSLKYYGLKHTIKILNSKVKKLNEAFRELRSNMTNETSKIKNEALVECSKEIEEAIMLYDADKVALIDYALESAGGCVTSTPDTIPLPSQTSYKIMGLLNVEYPSNPSLLIQPGNLPGQCFAFKGPTGKIRIVLTQEIQITAVTLEHAHPNLVDNMKSAPKDFKVYGLERANSKTGDELGTFTYDLDKRHLQTFYIVQTKKSYEHVELRILTNHGNEKYTCVYRFRVHGDKINAPKKDVTSSMPTWVG